MISSSNQQRGIQLFELARFKDALKYFESAIQEDGSDFLSKYYLALSYYNLEDYDRSLELCNALLSEAPDDSDVFYLKARIALQNDDNSQALKLVNIAISMNPYDADYFGLKAGIFLELKKFEDALEIVNEGLKIDPKNAFCLNVRAQILTKLNRKKEAKETVVNILNDNPEDSYSHANVGWVELENGNVKKALNHFKESLQKNPNNEYAREGMSTALKAKNFVYNAYLKYAFWISKQSSKNQWAFIIGIYLAYRFSVKLLSANGLNYLAFPIIFLYLVFALGGWIMEPLSNTILMFDKYGKYLLNKNESWSGKVFGGLISFSLISVSLFYVTSNNYYLLTAVTFLCALIPLPRAFLESTDKSKNFGFLTGGLILLIGVMGSMVIPNLYTVGAIVLILMIAYTWIANAIN